VQEAEFQKLKEENQGMQQIKVDSAELTRLRNEQEELLRLRNESGQLQKQVKQLTSQLALLRTQTSVATQQQHKSTELASENESLRTQNEQLQERQAQVAIDACVRNMRVIAAAKDLWASDNHKPQGSTPTQGDLINYLPNNVFPACPAGGKYNINAIGIAPACSIPSHVMPAQ